jgi:hypothetical protein
MTRMPPVDSGYKLTQTHSWRRCDLHCPGSKIKNGRKTL